MPDQNRGTLEALGIEIVQVFQPLKERVTDGKILLLLAELGVQFPPELNNPGSGFFNAMNTLVSDIIAMPPLVQTIITNIAAENWQAVGEASAQLVQKIVDAVDKFITVKDAIESYLNSHPITDVGGTLANFVGNFVSNLLDYLLIHYLEQKSEIMVAAFEFFGIVERSVQNQGSSNPVFPEFVRYKLHLNNVVEFFKNPATLLANLYDWGKPSFTGASLLEKLHKLALGFGFPSVYTPSPAELDILFLKITVNNTLSPPGLNIEVSDKINLGAGFEFGNQHWKLRTELDTEIAASAGVVVKPGGDLDLIPPSGSFEGDLTIKFSVPGDGGSGNPYILIGQAGASRFEFKKFEVEAGAGLTWNSGTNKAEGRWHVQASLEEGKIIIKPSNPDGFLAKILPPEGFIIDLSLVIGYDSARGFYFDGSGGFEIQLPLHLQLGPLSIDAITLAIRAGNAGIPIEIGADLGLTLGPFAAAVQNMGIKANITFPAGNTGNLGFADIDVDFKPPTGVGLSIDAGVVKGGGFLSFDYDRGRYTGVVQLSIKEMVNVTAIGLITTKLPDGSPGFSMLLIITAEFTPIQLGFGFTLNGVGGLIGVNRTMVLQALRDGVRSNTLDNILFPSDPIAHVNEILHDMETVFPQQQGRYTFGLMGKLGWGTPTLISLEIGLMLEVPNPVRLAILGVIKMILPTEEAAILKLQVNFVGTIDFEAKYITFDASLFDSKLLIFTLEGDMALRIKWGDNSNFLFTVGGFHPDYVPPPLDLPQLRRLSISLLGDNPRLMIYCYFAVTSNTVQFGAGIDFNFDVSVARVTGYMHFDALFQFNPFYFKISLDAGLSVYIFGIEMLTIQLTGILEGPTPWHITGRVKIKIFFVINVNVSVETTWGETKNTSLPDKAVLPELKTALENKANWISAAETDVASNDNLVRMRTITNDDEHIIAHPNHSLSVSQKVVPLDIEIARFGTCKPSDFTKFHVDVMGQDDVDIPDSPVKDEFAPVSFFDINGSDKLKHPSFEKYNSGVSASGTNELITDYFREREVHYEEILYDHDDREPDPIYHRVVGLAKRRLSVPMFNAFIKNGSAAQSVMGKANKKRNVLAPTKVELAGPQFSLVQADSLAVFESIHASSMAEAQAQLADVLRTRPELEGSLNIVPSYEIA